VIDLRSDWVTRPTEAMWDAMRAADRSALGRVEGRAAELLGKEAALWTPTCTAANLVALLTLAQPGERVALEPEAHILTTEGMGIAHIAHLDPVGLDRVGDAALLCLENTHTRAGGTVLSVEETARLAALAPRMHLDGARLPNAAAALGVSLATLATPAHTVAMSLNKGLGAPIGAVLAGDATTIAAARERLRQVGGASVHSAYLLAAAGLVALDRVDRIGEDHRRARELADRLAAIDGVTVQPPETNIVFFSAGDGDAASFLDRLAERGVLGYLRDDSRVRFVTHREIDDEALERAAKAVEETITPRSRR
jgi:threonine aldolase